MSFEEVLKVVPNPACAKGCNKERREEVTENELCNGTLSVSDQLPIRCVGEWAVEKIFMLVQYFGIFANGMKNKWGGKLNYIEICSGPGRCINRKNGEEFNGTALAILEHSSYQHIAKSLFFDVNPFVVDALNQRIGARGVNNATALLGNYNDVTDICTKIERFLRRDGLNIVFIDPTDCSVPFQLVKGIKEMIPNTDIIINIASMTDFNRNVGNALSNPEKYQNLIRKYDKFLDYSGFFLEPDHKALARSRNFQELRRLFRATYTENLKKLGYGFFDFTTIHGYYDILYASGNEKGIDFWKKAQAIKFDGQRKLF